MPVTESERFTLHEQLAEKIGPEPAGTLMTQLPRVDSDELATKTDLRQLGNQLQAEMSGLKSELRGEMRAMQGEMKELRAEMTNELTSLRAEMQGELTGLRTEMTNELTGLRTEMTNELTGLRTEFTNKLADHSRTIILSTLAMTVPIWVTMLVALLIGSTG